MKRIFLLLAVLPLLCCNIYAQKITKNAKDEFTGRQVIETSWVSISDGFNCMIRVSHNSPILNVVFNAGSDCLSMDKDAEFMIKMDNDSIITLKNIEYTISEVVRFNGLSHFNLKTRYPIFTEELNELKQHKIVMVRFVTNDGYITRNVSKGNSTKLMKLFNLIE